jgi:tRNA (guanine-N7-)-methyltransferase
MSAFLNIKVVTNMDSPKPLRTIRSFVRRLGRLTSGQDRALEVLLPIYGINFIPEQKNLNLNDAFGRQAPVMLDIGFGRGESTFAFAQNHPDWNVLGVEVHLPGVGHLLHQTEEAQLNNIRVMTHDVIEVLQHAIPNHSLDKVQLFFPDPWHKKRHNKRRIVQTAFIELLLTKLAPGGILHFATDWQEYAEHMLAVLRQFPQLTNLSPNNDYIERPADRPLTKFEKRGHRLGHSVFDIEFQAP